MKPIMAAAALFVAILPGQAAGKDEQARSSGFHRLVFRGDGQVLSVVLLAALVSVVVILTLNGDSKSNPASP